MMRMVLFGSALAALPLMASAQAAPDLVEMSVKQEIAFDADHDGKEDRILILSEGCDRDECPVVLVVPEGTVTLGYGNAVETGYVTPDELGVNNPQDYPAKVPVVKINGVMMAYNGSEAFPVADLISNGYFEEVTVTQEDLKWLSEKTNSEVGTEQVMKVIGDISPSGKDVVYTVSSTASPNTNAWFIRSALGNETLRGFSMDYPRIYQNGDGAYKVLSVSLSGLGVIDLSFKEK